MILIEWTDAESIDEWTQKSEIDHGSALIKSVGWILNENKKTVTLALNYDTKNDAYSCIIKLPIKMITKRSILHEQRRNKRNTRIRRSLQHIK